MPYSESFAIGVLKLFRFFPDASKIEVQLLYPAHYCHPMVRAYRLFLLVASPCSIWDRRMGMSSGDALPCGDSELKKRIDTQQVFFALFDNSNLLRRLDGTSYCDAGVRNYWKGWV